MDTDTWTTLKRFESTLKAQGKSASTVEAYSRDARQFLNFLASIDVPFKDAQPASLKAYFEDRAVNHHETENSIRRSVIGIRQFYRHLSQDGLQKYSPFDDTPIPQRVEKAPDSKVLDIIAKSLEGDRLSTSLKDSRDRLIICLLGLEGLKTSELIELKWEAVLLSGNLASIHVMGSRARVNELSLQTLVALNQYRKLLLYQYGENSPLLLPQAFVLIAFRGREPNNVIPHMTRHGLKFLLYEYGAEIGVDHLNAETLRHHAVVKMIESGLSPEAIMKKLGLRRLGNIKKHFNQALTQSKQ